MDLKHALIIPGFDERKDERYTELGSVFAARGIEPYFVPIDWPRTDLTRNIDQFSSYYDRYDRRKTVIFGFSVGAMIALVQSSVRPPAALILASLSPWFKEDIPTRSASHLALPGHRRMADYDKYEFSRIAPLVVSTTYILVGEREARRLRPLMTRSQAAVELIPGASLTIVPDAPHDFAHPDYLSALTRIIKGL
ncbi:MAG TPA: hypothetical protein VMS08_01930 [Candidatus Saccharimonadia bacterium]|nr:hypothetical protein [Candidatus Saccharimonadia bacterium]